jgi:hypothetical protein
MKFSLIVEPPPKRSSYKLPPSRIRSVSKFCNVSGWVPEEHERSKHDQRDAGDEEDEHVANNNRRFERADPNPTISGWTPIAVAIRPRHRP